MLMKTPEAELLSAQFVCHEPVWTAARLFPGLERKAQMGVEDLGFGTSLPTMVETVHSAQGVRKLERPMLGPYMLIALQPWQFTEWSRINAVEGVARYLVVDGRPLTVSSREAARLMLAHVNRECDFSTYRPGWRDVSPDGRPRKVSVKPKIPRGVRRAQLRAKRRLKEFRTMRRRLDRMLAESRKG